jgi:hypothetical protein
MSILPLLTPLFALLGVYEVAKGIIAFRRGARPLLVIKDFCAAVVMFIVVILLYKLDSTFNSIAPVHN